MEITKTSLEGVLLIKPDVFEDHRGQFVVTYNRELYKKHGVNLEFVEEDISMSTKGVLRGIHYDPLCWKLTDVLHGTIYCVLVDCDEKSPTFGKWQSFIHSDRNHLQLFRPPKYGTAFLALTDEVIFHYKQSEYYDPKRQLTFRWDDPRFGIWWPTTEPILSERDEMGRRNLRGLPR